MELWLWPRKALVSHGQESEDLEGCLISSFCLTFMTPFDLYLTLCLNRALETAAFEFIQILCVSDAIVLKMFLVAWYAPWLMSPCLMTLCSDQLQ